MKDYTQHHQVIPAQPGWFACEPIQGDNGIEGLAEHPIVAWVITYDLHRSGETSVRMAEPVSVDDCASDCPIIKCPDGVYLSPGHRVYPDYDAVVAELIDDERRARQRRGGAA